MMHTITFHLDGPDELEEQGKLTRHIAADDMTAYIWSMQEYMFSLCKRGDLDEDGHRLLDLIMNEMQQSRSALVEAALDTWCIATL